MEKETEQKHDKWLFWSGIMSFVLFFVVAVLQHKQHRSYLILSTLDHIVLRAKASLIIVGLLSPQSLRSTDVTRLK